MAIDWQERWDALNERQQQFMGIIFELDQQAEERKRADWKTDWRKTEDWRRLTYVLFNRRARVGGELYERLYKAGLVNEGTGSTFEALAHRDYIKYEPGGGAGYAPSYVWLTTKGRKLVRTARGITLPPRMPPGTLQEWQWSALVGLYDAFDKGLHRSTCDKQWGYDATYRLIVYKPMLARTGYGEIIYITLAGIEHYETRWAGYRDRYPNVEAPPPSQKILPITPGQRLRSWRGQRSLREISAMTGLSMGTLAMAENGKPLPPELFEDIKRLLGIEDSNFK